MLFVHQLFLLLLLLPLPPQRPQERERCRKWSLLILNAYLIMRPMLRDTHLKFIWHIEEHDISLLLRNCEFSRSVGLAFYKVYWWEYDAAADDDDDNDRLECIEHGTNFACFLCAANNPIDDTTSKTTTGSTTALTITNIQNEFSFVWSSSWFCEHYYNCWLISFLLLNTIDWRICTYLEIRIYFPWRLKFDIQILTMVSDLNGTRENMLDKDYR